MTHWTDAKPHTWDNRRDGQDLTDEQVADKVCMLMRSDMDHEHVCTLARDRIASLARWHDMLRDTMEKIATGEVRDAQVAASAVLNNITGQRCTNPFNTTGAQ